MIRGSRSHDRRSRRVRASGFTLLEVLLAVAIAGGLLAVALFFYRQSTVFRDGVLDEMGRIGAARQVMRRLSTELTCLAPEAGALRGTATEIEFAFAAVLAGDAAGDGLRQVRYILPEPDLTADPEATAGPLQRQETPLTAEEPVVEEGAETDLVTFSSLVGGNEGEPAAAATGQTTIAEVGFLQLRYWDGAEWQEEWRGAESPLGVEITLGHEPLDPDTLPEDYPHEVFRRLIALPVSGPAAVSSAGRPPASRSSEESNPGAGAGTDEDGTAGSDRGARPPDSGRFPNRGRRGG
jgi:prepilin-type N-terminal cleavage/methylation domain-containing protein